MVAYVIKHKTIKETAGNPPTTPKATHSKRRPLIEYFGDSSCAGISAETSEENQQCNDQYGGVTMAGNFTLVLPYLSYSSWSTAQIYEAFMG